MISDNPFGLAFQISEAARSSVNLGKACRPPMLQKKGLFVPQKTTEKVFEFLKQSGDFHRQNEVRKATQCSHSAVSWSLIFLRRIGAVEAVADEARNCRYLRYRYKKTK